MNSKMKYEKPSAEYISFHIEGELMNGEDSLSIGGGVAPLPSKDQGLNDKSSYQLLD